MPRYTLDPQGKRYRLPIVITGEIMRWIFESSKYMVAFAIDQCRFAARLRRNKQITFPISILKVFRKQLSDSVGEHINLEDLINSEFVFEVKAVRYRNVWYRVSTIVENKSE